MVGDSSSDIGCGKKVGAYTILVRTNNGGKTPDPGEVLPDLVVGDLDQAARRIQSRLEFSRRS